MKKNLFYGLLMVMLLALAGLACGGSDPVVLGDLPVPEGATALAAGDSLVADFMAEAVQGAVPTEDATTEVKIYRAPAGATFATTEAFYTDNLGSDWTYEADLSQEQDGIGIAGWSYGSLASEQVFVVAFSEDPLLGDNILVVALLSE